MIAGVIAVEGGRPEYRSTGGEKRAAAPGSGGKMLLAEIIGAVPAKDKAAAKLCRARPAQEASGEDEPDAKA